MAQAIVAIIVKGAGVAVIAFGMRCSANAIGGGAARATAGVTGRVLADSIAADAKGTNTALALTVVDAFSAVFEIASADKFGNPVGIGGDDGAATVITALVIGIGVDSRDIGDIVALDEKRAAAVAAADKAFVIITAHRIRHSRGTRFIAQTNLIDVLFEHQALAAAACFGNAKADINAAQAQIRLGNRQFDGKRGNGRGSR